MPVGATPQEVIERFGFTRFAANWSDEADLESWAAQAIENARDVLKLQADLANIYATGTAAQQRVLARVEALRAACEMMKRMIGFRAFGQQAPLDMATAGEMEALCDAWELEAENALGILLGSITQGTGPLGPISHGFDERVQPITRDTIW